MIAVQEQNQSLPENFSPASMPEKQGQKDKDVVLFSSNVVNEIILNDILVAFSQEYPEIFVNNMIVDWKEGYQKISAMPSALAFLAYWPEKNFLEGFDFVPALQSHNVAIMSKTHPLAQNSYVTVPQLSDYKLIALTKNLVTDTEVFEFLEKYLSTRKVSLTEAGFIAEPACWMKQGCIRIRLQSLSKYPMNTCTD